MHNKQSSTDIKQSRRAMAIYMRRAVAMLSRLLGKGHSTIAVTITATTKRACLFWRLICGRVYRFIVPSSLPSSMALSDTAIAAATWHGRAPKQ